MNTYVDTLAKTIWDYMLMHQEIKPADVIFVLGSNNTKVAERAAELYLEGFAPLIVCAGGFGKGARFTKPEAEVFKDVIVSKGVPEEKILMEPLSTNTGENIRFTKKLLEEKGIEVYSFILVQKPYMERRTFATFRKQWEGPAFMVTSPQISYEEYASDLSLKKSFIETMVGDLIRMKEYPKLGFQIEQEIPDDVWGAGQELIVLGFDKYAKL